MVVDMIFWIYDKLTHNTTRWFTADGKIRGAYINHIGMGLAEDWKIFPPAHRKFYGNWKKWWIIAASNS